MATTQIVRGKTLPDSGVKNDLHELIDLSTVTITNIVNADVSNTAAIAGTKISPNFGAQDIIGDTVKSNSQFLDEQTDAPETGENQGAIYTKNDGTQTELYFVEESEGDEVQITKGGRVNVSFGAYETTDASQVGGTGATLASDGSLYTSSTNGIVSVVSTMTVNQTASVKGYTDNNADPTTLVAVYGDNGAVFDTGVSLRSFSFAVKSGNKWKVVKSGTIASTTVYFTPLS
jgi:uncharacterized membrane protein